MARPVKRVSKEKISKTMATNGTREATMSSLFTPLPSKNPVVDVETLVNDMNKKYGKNAVVYASDERLKDTRPRISTGSLSTDYMMGGWAKGRHNTVSGGSGVGKSHEVYKAIAWYQRMFPTETIVLINAEDSYEESFAIMAGIDVNSPNFIVNNPESLEEALNLARDLQKAGVGLIVIDSIESLASDKDLNTDAGDSKQMGVKQKMLGDFMKITVNRNNKAVREGFDGTTFIEVMQLRSKIGIVFGDPMFEPGGAAMEFYPHNKIRLMETEKVRDPKTKQIISSTITATTNKSRQVGKGKSISYKFRFVSEDGTPTGIDHYQEVIDIGFLEGFITELEKQNVSILGQWECKQNKIREFLVNNSEALETLYIEVMKVLKVKMGHHKLEQEAVEPAKKKTRGRPAAAKPKVADTKKKTRGRPRGTA